jgi:hypothetical protein
MWLIILDERIPDDEAEGFVAHEIAHAWLRHGQLSPEIPDSCEVAAVLAKSWGFTGKGPIQTAATPGAIRSQTRWSNSVTYRAL